MAEIHITFLLIDQSRLHNELHETCATVTKRDSAYRPSLAGVTAIGRVTRFTLSLTTRYSRVQRPWLNIGSTKFTDFIWQLIATYKTFTNWQE